MPQPIEPSRLAWLVNRLSIMSAAEMRYRAWHALGTLFARPLTLKTAAVITPAPPWMDVHPADIVVEPYLTEADAILNGWVSLFSSQQVNVGTQPQWNCQPLDPNGKPAGAGDIKYLWELNRHLHWVRLAQAYVLSGDARYSDGLATQIESWLAQCPPATGPNWSSASELADRLINWSVVWQLLGGWDGLVFKGRGGEQLRSRWLSSIEAHCQYISRNLSRHSSANNHLIGELTGLFVAARTWPMPTQSERWGRMAKAELECEAVVQHYPDGGNREQAVAYQVFASEYLLIAGVCGQRSNDPFSAGYWAVLQRACSFLSAMQNAGGTMPMVGDADDGAVLRLEPRDGASRADILLSFCSAVFGQDNTPLRNTARWLGAERLLMQPATDRNLSGQFRDSGYYLFGSRFNTRNEIKGMIDCGALGYLGIAAHGHADTLAIWLSIAGEECLVDAGTYAYGDDYAWRAYFRGTSAHNTVRIDGVDQSVNGGRFLWKRKAHARVVRCSPGPEPFQFTGTHDGYTRLRDPVHHTRHVTYYATQLCLCVIDEISGQTAHDIEQFWHFAPHLDVRMNGTGQVIVRGRRFELTLQSSLGGTAIRLLRGEENPPLGWYSRAYGVKVPCTVARVYTRSCPTVLETRFSIRMDN